MSISGSISNRLIAKDTLSDYTSRERSMTLSAPRKVTPMSSVGLRISGLAINVAANSQVLLLNPAQILDEHRAADSVEEIEYISRVSEVKKLISDLKSGKTQNSTNQPAQQGQQQGNGDDSEIQRFCTQFNCNRDTAKFYLEAYGTYTLAANNYMNNNGQ